MAVSLAAAAFEYSGILRAPLLDVVTPARPAPVEPLAATVVLLKSERRMELWLRSNGVWRKTRDYGLVRVHGMAGPKLAARDGQVPEGFYDVRKLDPLVLDYPNDFDRRMARRDLRGGLGDGFTLSGGVQAEPAIWQDLAALLSGVACEHVHVIVAPNDVRLHPPVKSGRPMPAWVPELYGKLAQLLQTDYAVRSAVLRSPSQR
jgi:hypothetical protein